MCTQMNIRVDAIAVLYSDHNSMNNSDRLNDGDEFFDLIESSTMNPNTTSPHPTKNKSLQQRQSISNNINLLNGMAKSDFDIIKPLDEQAMEIESTNKAL